MRNVLLAAALASSLGCGGRGRDDDGDDLREAPCRSAEGTVIIENSLDLDDLADVCELNGTMSIAGLSLTAVHLPRLTRLKGSISITGNEALATVEAPHLTSISGALVVNGNLSMTSLSLPVLADVSGDLRVTNNPTLQTFEAPSLESVGGDLIVSSDGSMSYRDMSFLVFPLLKRIDGDIVITDNPALAKIRMTGLEVVTGTIAIADNPALLSCAGSRIVDEGDCATASAK